MDSTMIKIKKETKNSLLFLKIDWELKNMDEVIKELLKGVKK